MRLGGFCETRGVREDYDLWLRMATEGRFHYVDAPLAVYRRHETNLSNNEPYMFEWEAGALNRLEWTAIEDALRRAYPDEAERAIIEGEVRLRRGEFGIAEMHFLKLARQPRAAAALFHLAHLMMRRGALDYAEPALRRALAEEPDDAALWNNLGVVLVRSGRMDDAADAFAYAVDLRPHYRDAAVNLERVLHGQAGPWKVTRRRLRTQLLPLAAAA
jgi:tetratricopeptide (TPR) repeat protein